MDILTALSGVTLISRDGLVSPEALAEELRRQSANLAAAEADWMTMLAVFDDYECWSLTGELSCVAWLSRHCGMDRITAHEKLRVAHALTRLTMLTGGFRTGVLSYSKVRALTRIATPSNEKDLFEIGLHATAAQVERIVAAWRRVDADADRDEQAAYDNRNFSVRHDGATAVVTMRMTAVQAAVYCGAVDHFVDKQDLRTPLRARRVDAAVAMAEHAVATINHDATGTSMLLATLHVTTDADDAEGGHGVCAVAPGDGLGADPVAVPLRTVEQFLCDCAMQAFRHTPDGPQVSPTVQTVPARLKKALRLRDERCRFPGCDHKAWVDAHHIRSRREHGPTVSTNLVCLCRRHHRLVHTAGWTITGNPDDPNRTLIFTTPRGVVLTEDAEYRIGDPTMLSMTERHTSWRPVVHPVDPCDANFIVDVLRDNDTLRQRPDYKPPQRHKRTYLSLNDLLNDHPTQQHQN